MKLLRRNLTEFEYRAYVGREEILENDRHTGKYEAVYEDPVMLKGNISIPTGMAQNQWFGIDADYSHVLLMDDLTVEIKEDSIIDWKGNQYIVRAVRPSLNVNAYALKKTKKPSESEW